MFAASIAVHLAVFGVVWALSAWKVDELFGRQVQVSVQAPEPELGPDGKPKHRLPTNIGRALGFHFIVTPAGAKAEPRPDGVAASTELVDQLRPLVMSTLLPSLVYPNDAKSLRLRGAVSVLVDVDSQGAVTSLDVKLPCSNQLLCKVAKEAVAQIKVWPSSQTAAERSFLIPIEYRPD